VQIEFKLTLKHVPTFNNWVQVHTDAWPLSSIHLNAVLMPKSSRQ